MLQELVTATTAEDFMNICRKFTNADDRLEFAKEFNASGYVLSADDMMTAEELTNAIKDERSILSSLQQNSSDTSRSLVRRLQIIGGCNPGIQAFIKNFLQRACL